MEKRYIEMPEWLHRQTETWNSYTPKMKMITKIGFIYLIIIFLSHMRIIIIR